MPQVKWEVSLGTIIHAVLLLATIGSIYGSFSSRFDEYGTALRDVRRQTTRIEHYLNSQDREYWHKTAQNGDGTEEGRQ